MNQRDTTINDSSFKKLLHNDNYYRHIFKKTEKIISVVFYILNNTQSDKKTDTLISNIASKAHFAHENALRTLEAREAASKEVLEQFAQALVGLESTLRVASVAGVIAHDVLQVMVSEIDTVLRSLKTYLQEGQIGNELSFGEGEANAFGVQAQSVPLRPARRSIQSPEPRQSKAADANDRKGRIKTILEAKGEATIKDIAEIITDVSEKTIQRELNAMIDEGVVKRQGERRWSKYSIF